MRFGRPSQGEFMFSIAVMTGAKQEQPGRKLIEFLRTPEAVAVIRAKGMAPATP